MKPEPPSGSHAAGVPFAGCAERMAGVLCRFRCGILAGFAMVLVYAGCERHSVREGILDDSPGVTVRDSAGVRIVANHSPERDAGLFWNLDLAPVIAIGGIGTHGAAASDSSAPLPLFGARSEVAGGGNPLSVYITTGDRNEIHEFSAAGILRRIIRRTTDPIPITQEEREAALGLVVGRNPAMDFRAWQKVMDALPRRDHYPLANRLMVDSQGYLWVKDNKSHNNESQWSVFRQDGRWLGTLTVPVSRLFSVHEDLLLGVNLGDFDSELVVGYRLNRIE